MERTATKLYRLKGQDSKIKPYSRCLGNIQKILLSITWIKGFNRWLCGFSADFKTIVLVIL